MLYPLCVAGAFSYFALVYLPHLFVDHLAWLSLALNPGWAFWEYPTQVVLAGIALAFGFACPLGASRLRLFWLRGLRMCVGFALGFASVQYAATTGSLDFPGTWSHTFDAQNVSLVEIARGRIDVRKTPSPDAQVVSTLAAGHRAPLDQLAETRRQGRWFRVHLGPDRFGWIPEVPTGSGDPVVLRIVPGEFRALVALDLYALGAGAVLSLLVPLSSARSDARRRLASV